MLFDLIFPFEMEGCGVLWCLWLWIYIIGILILGLALMIDFDGCGGYLMGGVAYKWWVYTVWRGH